MCLPVSPQLLPWLYENVHLAQHSLGNIQTVCRSKAQKNSLKHFSDFIVSDTNDMIPHGKIFCNKKTIIQMLFGLFSYLDL